jgi:hypothetical protein
VDEARRMYDALVPVGPIMVRGSSEATLGVLRCFGACLDCS